MPVKSIYPIFLPHAGCPFQCVYCDQNVVTLGWQQASGTIAILEYFESRLEGLLKQAGRSKVAGEIAFYGGTFTAIPVEDMRFILDTVSPWVERGMFSGIRFSTRPDCLGHDVCTILAEYPIQTVELGVQSLADDVLSKSLRGYSSVDIKEAATAVRERGWQLGIQLMLGLPGDNRQKFLESVLSTIELKPDFVRLYPTLVLANTVLADWYASGFYRPLTLDEAIDWCAQAYAIFVKADIAVARMGLHADPALEKPGTVLDGPYHPAFGYLVKVHWWRREVDRCLALLERTERKLLNLRVSERYISEVRGPKQANISYWLTRWLLDQVEVKGESGWAYNRYEANLK